jgi:purine nucleosidase
MAARQIILDCDPGQDDAMAILLALASGQEIDLIGITTVAGNVPLPLTQLNARKICELAGRTDMPVYAGCSRPILRKLVTAEYVHGKTGLDGADLAEPTMALQQGHAVDFIVDSLMERPVGSVTLCPIGPLTNVALAMIKQPEIIQRIDEIILMGGGMAEGNVTPAAEFNIYVDPHAARVVFEAGVKLTMLGLDVTHQALATPARMETINGIGSAVSDAVVGLLDFFNRFDRERYGMPGAPLHDPCVIAYLLRPDLFQGRDCHVAVETDSELTMGATIVDWWGANRYQANARVINGVDADGFFGLFTERLRRL